jgi:hypothetical protein
MKMPTCGAHGRSFRCVEKDDPVMAGRRAGPLRDNNRAALTISAAAKRR